MANIRREIRNAVVARLDQAIFHDNKKVPVFDQRYSSVKFLPAIVVYIDGDTSEKSSDQQANRRTNIISIRVYFDGTEAQEQEGIDRDSAIDGSDAIAKQIEDIFDKDPRESLEATVEQLVYMGTQIKTDASNAELVKIVTSIIYEALHIDQLGPKKIEPKNN